MNSKQNLNAFMLGIGIISMIVLVSIAVGIYGLKQFSDENGAKEHSELVIATIQQAISESDTAVAFRTLQNANEKTDAEVKEQKDKTLITLSEVKNLVSDNRQQTENVSNVGLLFLKRMDALDGFYATSVKNGNGQITYQIDASQRNLRARDELKTAFDSLRTVERALYNERAPKANKTQYLFLLALGAAVVILIAVFIVSTIFIYPLLKKTVDVEDKIGLLKRKGGANSKEIEDLYDFFLGMPKFKEIQDEPTEG